MAHRLTLDSRARRLAAFGLFYLSEGLPIGFSTVALAAYLRQQNVSMAGVGAMVAATYAPWAFKFAWAPLVDLIHVRRFGHSRTWIILCQSMMILTMSALFAFDPVHNLALLTTLMIVHNTFAATNDVAIDAMAVRVLPVDEVGTANGCMFAAQFAGIGLGGSGAIYVAGLFGFRVSLLFLLLMMTALLLGVTLPLLEPASLPTPPLAGTLLAAVLQRLRLFFRDLRSGFFDGGMGPLVGALFAVFPHGAMALGLATATGIQVDMKLSQNTISSIALSASIAGALGCLFGGWLSDRTGKPRGCITVSYVLSAVATTALALRFTGTGVAGVTVTAFLISVLGQTFFYGMQQGAMTGLFMRLSSPAVAATQFTGYMALCNLASVYSSTWQGKYSDAHGYSAMLLLDSLLAFSGLVIMPWVRTRKRPGIILEAVPLATPAQA